MNEESALTPGPSKSASRQLCIRRPPAFIEFKEDDVEQSISSRFEKQVSQYPERTALQTKDCAVTYASLNQRANRISHVIRAKANQGNEPVAFLLEHGAPEIVAILGILKAGKIYVPMDPSFPKVRLASMLEDSQAELVITNDRNLALARELTANKPRLVNIDQFDPSVPTTNLELDLRPDTIANILYTSGSTGEPKGVVQNHLMILHAVMSATNDYGISLDDRIALLFSASFAASIIPIFGPLLNGAALFPYDLKGEGLTRLPEWLADNQITFYKSVASAFRRFASILTDADEFPHLRLIVLGGEPVYRADVGLYKRHFSDECMFCVILAGTEMHTIRSLVIGKNTHLSDGIVPVGYPVKDKRVLLLDAEGRQMGPNEIGEIAVVSRYLSIGYWRKPELTQAAFEPSANGERIHLTGDLGRLRSDGCLEHLGRKDSRAKIRGHRVELGEVEAVLLDLEEVSEAAVLVREDEKGRTYLTAYVVPSQMALPTTDTLRACLAQTLPDYMIPSHFITLENLPLTGTGKLDKRALPEPTGARPAMKADFLEPRTESEVKLQQIWQEILDVRPIGIQDSFFDLGGDSLAAVGLFTAIERTFHFDLPTDVLINAPTIEQIAAILSQQDKSRYKSSLVPIQPNGSLPPFFCAPGINGDPFVLRHLGYHLGPRQPFYGLRYPRKGGKRIPYATIEGIAAHYVKEILEHQPQGHYYLGGYSLGCLVAFEMAQQLLESGRQVRLLVFLDMQLYRSRKPGFFLKIGARELMERYGLSQVVLKAPKIVAKRFYLLAKRFAPDSIWPLNILDASRLARDAYVPKAYPSRVIFLQTKENRRSREKWENLVAGGIESHEVPGDHLTLLKEPYVQVLAEKLKECLSEAQGRKHM